MTRRKLAAVPSSAEVVEENASPTLADLTPDAFRDFDADTDVAIVIRMDATTNQLYCRAYNTSDADAGLNMIRLGTAITEGTIAALTQRLQGVVASLTQPANGASQG